MITLTYTCPCHEHDRLSVTYMECLLFVVSVQISKNYSCSGFSEPNLNLHVEVFEFQTLHLDVAYILVYMICRRLMYGDQLIN